MDRKSFFKALGSIALSTTALSFTRFRDEALHASPTPKMPVLFLGHGSPMNAIEENDFVTGFRNVAAGLERPNAILCISAHWETDGTRVTAMERPRTIHDFRGFPPALYQVQYPAPGSPALAEEIAGLSPMAQIRLDHAWGLDHGAWSVIRHLYPGADVPVLQLSLDRRQPASFHYALGKELAALRERGILIIGSGNMVHHLGLVAWDRLGDEEYGFDWALEARSAMNRHILEGRHDPLIDYRSQGRAFQLAIPTPEHFLPLLYVLGLQQKGEEVHLFNDRAIGGSLTMTSVRIG